MQGSDLIFSSVWTAIFPSLFFEWGDIQTTPRTIVSHTRGSPSGLSFHWPSCLSQPWHCELWCLAKFLSLSLSFVFCFVCFWFLFSDQQCSGYFHPFSFFIEFGAILSNSREISVGHQAMLFPCAGSSNPHHCLMEVSAIFPMLPLRCTEMGCWPTATKHSLFCLLPAPSSPRQHRGRSDKPETTKPGLSAESLAVPAVTLLTSLVTAETMQVSKSKRTT